MTVLVFVLLTLVLVVLAQDIETNNKCNYTLGKSVLTCSRLTNVDKNIDQFLTPSTRMLVIKNTDTAKFTSYYHNVTNYQYVVNYNIIENNPLEIEEMAFYGMGNLQYLKINRNFFPTVKNNTFRGLGKLKVLNLAENNIMTIEKGAFGGLTNLLTLDIAKNNLEVIPSNLFSNLVNLENLLLEHNNIKIIETNGFFGLSEVYLLDMSSNALSKLNADNFNVLRSLGVLYLNFNKIEDISGNFDLPKLTFLELHDNKLKTIHEDTFKGLTHIFSIDLSNNELAINAKPFRNISSLIHLNLKLNKVNESDFTDLQEAISVVL